MPLPCGASSWMHASRSPVAREPVVYYHHGVRVHRARPAARPRAASGLAVRRRHSGPLNPAGRYLLSDCTGGLRQGVSA